MCDDIDVDLFIIDDALAQLKVLHLTKPEVAKLVAINFIQPLKAGNPATHLQGKYKPSWEISESNTKQALQSLARLYRDNNLYHYHFGYPSYKKGVDPLYPGDESAGILHTVFKTTTNSEFHALLLIDETHPRPFKVPILLLRQVPTAM